MTFEKTTEKESKYNHLEKMSTLELLKNINKEDQTVPLAVKEAIPQIEILVDQIVLKLKNNGRLFYIGAGTSGRLGIVDASECPPTFGVPYEMVIGLIAGGDKAIRRAVEFAEDSKNQGWIDLKSHNVSTKDIVIGIAASGSTPYVIEAVKKCNHNNIITGSISCNKNSPLSNSAKFPVDIVVGPEFLTGSSRMKAGTAQKLVLNMLTTSTMIKLSRVKGNKMLDMQLSNNKLVNRGVKIIMSELNIDEQKAISLLKDNNNNVRASINAYNISIDGNEKN